MAEEPPVGSTTGSSHEHSAAVDEAARYLASVPPRERPKPLVPAMREMFGLTAVEVCQAIQESRLIRAREPLPLPARKADTDHQKKRSPALSSISSIAFQWILGQGC
jgi:hypothetical protein